VATAITSQLRNRGRDLGSPQQVCGEVGWIKGVGWERGMGGTRHEDNLAFIIDTSEGGYRPSTRDGDWPILQHGHIGGLLAGVQALGLGLAHRIAVSSFQFAENDCGEDGHCTQHKEGAVDAVNKLWSTGSMAIGNE
jgi:hypothetical protein